MEPSLPRRPRLSQALHFLDDPVHPLLRGSLLRLQILQALLQISGCPPQPVPSGIHYLQVLSHLTHTTSHHSSHQNNILHSMYLIQCSFWSFTVVFFFLMLQTCHQITVWNALKPTMNISHTVTNKSIH